MRKKRIAFITIFILTLLLAGCVIETEKPNIDETIKNGGAYKEEVSVNTKNNEVDKEIEADKENEADKEVEADKKVTDDSEGDELSKEIIEMVEGNGDESVSDKEQVDIESLKILSTHEIEAETLDLKGDLKIIVDKVHKAGGYISSNNLTNDLSRGTKLMKSELTLRVPRAEASSVIDTINKTVAITGEFSMSADVTDKYYDIEARIRNLESRESRLRELYNNSKDVNDIIAIDDKLFEVTEEREKMVQKKLRMEDRITFSRVDLSLQEVTKFSIAEEERESKMTGMEKISDSIISTSKLVGNSLVGLLSILIKITPLIILVAIGFKVYKIAIRKYEQIKESKESHSSETNNEESERNLLLDENDEFIKENNSENEKD